MITKQTVNEIVQEWLDDTEYFLVDVSVSPDNRIVVEIDHAEGVWIDDCVELSKFVESRLDRDQEDFELEVGSAGVGQPFKVHQQWVNHLDKDVEILTNDGRKMRGVLTEVSDETFTITTQQKVKAEGEKRPHMEDVPTTLRYDEVKYGKYYF